MRKQGHTDEGHQGAAGHSGPGPPPGPCSWSTHAWAPSALAGLLVTTLEGSGHDQGPGGWVWAGGGVGPAKLCDHQTSLLPGPCSPPVRVRQALSARPCACCTGKKQLLVQVFHKSGMGHTYSKTVVDLKSERNWNPGFLFAKSGCPPSRTSTCRGLRQRGSSPTGQTWATPALPCPASSPYSNLQLALCPD